MKLPENTIRQRIVLDSGTWELVEVTEHDFDRPERVYSFEESEDPDSPPVLKEVWAHELPPPHRRYHLRLLAEPHSSMVLRILGEEYPDMETLRLTARYPAWRSLMGSGGEIWTFQDLHQLDPDVPPWSRAESAPVKTFFASDQGASGCADLATGSTLGDATDQELLEVIDAFCRAKG